MGWNKENKLSYTNKLNQKMNQRQMQEEDVQFAYKRYALEYVQNLLVQKKVEATSMDDILKDVKKVHDFILPTKSVVKTL